MPDARQHSFPRPVDVAAGATVVIVAGAFLWSAASKHILGYDARTGYLPLAHQVVNGISPYPEANLPPLGFFLFIPFTPVPHPEILLTLVALALVPAVLLALDVRDWRCYGAAFVWAPVLSAVQTVNLTLPLVLAAALAWRWRDEAVRAAAATGLSIAAKLISAPLLVWLVATRRIRTAVLSAGIAVGVTLVLLGVVQFLHGAEATSFVRKAGGVPTRTDTPSYSPLDFAPAHGASRWVGAAVTLVVVVLLCGLSVHFARQGDDGRSFAAAATSIIVFAPNVWLHSLTFLLLPLGVLRPRFDWMWLVPVVLIPVGVENSSVPEFAFFWAVAVLMASWALARPARRSTPAQPVRASRAPAEA